MKFTTPLISVVALHTAAAVAQTASDCNVEGNLFTIVVNKQRGDTLMVNEVALTSFGDEGIDGRLILWNNDFEDPTQKRTSFYINKDTNRLVAINPFHPQIFATAYTEKAEGGEIKFTYNKDSTKDYHWPEFGIKELGKMTVKGNAFYLCGSTNGSVPLDGSLAIGNVAGKNCQPLDYTLIYPLDSNLL